MKKSECDEIRALSQRLFQKGEATSASFGSTIERYKYLATQAGHYPALNDALVEQAHLLMTQGRYCEALQVHEERLAQNPFDLAAHRNWRRLIGEIHEQLVKMAHAAPETAEYGRTYEKLLQIGCVGIAAHLGAVRHYLINGQVDRAVDRLVPLVRVCPNSAGVSDLLRRVASVSDDARIHQLKVKLEKGEL